MIRESFWSFAQYVLAAILGKNRQPTAVVYVYDGISVLQPMLDQAALAGIKILKVMYFNATTGPRFSADKVLQDAQTIQNLNPDIVVIFATTSYWQTPSDMFYAFKQIGFMPKQLVVTGGAQGPLENTKNPIFRYMMTTESWWWKAFGFNYNTAVSVSSNMLLSPSLRLYTLSMS